MSVSNNRGKLGKVSTTPGSTVFSCIIMRIMSFPGNIDECERKGENTMTSQCGVPGCQQLLVIIPIYCSVTRYGSSAYGSALTVWPL